MVLPAQVHKVTGKTTHSRGTIVNGKVVAGEPLPSPAYVTIESADGAFYLLYFDADGRCMTDTWHQTLDAAKRQAQFEFEIADGDWEAVT
ncbi:MAG TPA: hypothetical protein VGL61_11880 [Kofleriaceae bacterium]|jgi:hypothetical protein